MDDLELLSVIEQKIHDGSGGSIGVSEGQLSIERQDNFSRYMGELYGNEKEGQSQVVTREVMETVEWAMPSLMRIFASTDKVVEFDPVSKEDEAGAEQETDYVNYVFNKKNNGYEITHNWIKSGLMYPASYVKVYWSEDSETKESTYEGLDDEEMAMLAQSGAEILGVEQLEAGYTARVKTTENKGRLVVENVPEEELIIDADLACISLDNADFVCHRNAKTKSQLLEMGYDSEKLENVGSQDSGSFNSERVNRRFRTDETDYNSDESDIDESMTQYWIDECYLMVDFDDDGIAELRRVVRIGDVIFENEPTDIIPFASWSSIMMPNKHLGMSFVELVKDLQKIKTILMRQTLTNLYRVNNPRTVVGQGVNLDDLLTNRQDGIIRTKSMGDLSVEPTQAVIGQVLPAMQLLDEQKETRTGVSRAVMGLDADVLAKSTKGAFMGALDQANLRLELVARNFAEVGMKSLFKKIHHLLLTHQRKEAVFRLRNEYVKINPMEWSERSDLTVRVGLGNGNKEQQMSALMGIYDVQKEMLQNGMGGVTITPDRMFNTVEKLVEIAGFKNADKFFQNPANVPPQPQQPPPPDYQQIALQMQGQIESQRIELDKMKLQQKTQQEERELDARVAKDMTELELKYGVDVPESAV